MHDLSELLPASTPFTLLLPPSALQPTISFLFLIPTKSGTHANCFFDLAISNVLLKMFDIFDGHASSIGSLVRTRFSVRVTGSFPGTFSTLYTGGHYP